ncbi:SNF1-related protein kinase catalytic subunit alpha KIN10 [Porphyridium purpureum]|uniref:SNF1-related protein kinase catalytic subunit alpha KIN10 n=1 Tax=Porphyridium purpureum TaxID=35688 RepID=A0A5J4Z353_PORPP|nr:SNF1-related protein kinase catalytic subunit alpha KIN10 [Porphyridium purpureum]|eukprot:POR2597..scf208_2
MGEHAADVAAARVPARGPPGAAAKATNLRYGEPISMEGELEKEGKRFKGRKKRHFRLRDSALHNHRRRGSPPSWTVSLIDARVKHVEDGSTDFVIVLGDNKELRLVANNEVEKMMWVDAVSRASVRKIGAHYGVTGIIGTGSFAEVRLGYDKVSGDHVAIKIMKKNKKDKELMQSVECELNFVQKRILDQYVVQTYDVFNTKDNLFIVMEYMKGGMLYDILSTEGSLSEHRASQIMHDVFMGIKAMHDQDMVHRDLKPENVLCKSTTWPFEVKVADFGLADFVLENQFGDKCTRGMYGTPFFVAPEVVRGEAYGPGVDVWSLGVLLYNIISGELPFDGSNIKEVLRRVKKGEFSFPEEYWSHISPACMDLIRGMLTLDPKRRFTIDQCLKHEWIQSCDLSHAVLDIGRANLGSEARKSKMTSMAIDDIVEALELEDNELEAQQAAQGGSGTTPVSVGALSLNDAAKQTNHSNRSSSTQSSTQMKREPSGRTGKQNNSKKSNSTTSGASEDKMFKFGAITLLKSKKQRDAERRQSMISTVSQDMDDE